MTDMESLIVKLKDQIATLEVVATDIAKKTSYNHAAKQIRNIASAFADLGKDEISTNVLLTVLENTALHQDELAAQVKLN